MTDPGTRTPRATLAGCAALLLPLLAVADSQLVAGPARNALKASAHLDFKIVIPRVLSMDLGGALGGVSEADLRRNSPGGEIVAIYANSHNATLAATVPSSDRPRGNLILSSAARKVISENAWCAPAAPAPAAAHSGMICTASMP